MKKIVIFVILFTSVFLVGCSKNKDKMPVVKGESNTVKTISVDEVKKIIDHRDDYKNVEIIDVRTEEEYNEGHLASAKNIPLDQIQKLTMPKDTEIIVYCRSGSRSKQAAINLDSLGYENIKDMGGIINWEYDLVNN